MLFDLSSRTKLRLTGADRLRFLNGQITNDVRKATGSVGIEACVLSAKGKMNAHVFISSGLDCFFVDAAPELREVLPGRLERYVIADDVQIENVSDELSIFHLLGSAPPALESGGRIVSVRRFMESGWDVWIDAGRQDQRRVHQPAAFVGQERAGGVDQAVQEQDHGIFVAVTVSPYRLVDPTSAEVFRIEEGIPRWGRELTEEIIPIEANLEARAVDYEKGCYIGQEVISRIKMSGQTNKRLCGLVSSTPLFVGMKLVESAENGKQVGWITSVARNEGREIALGYVKRGFNNIGTKLDAIMPDTPGSGRALVEIVSLPFG